MSRSFFLALLIFVLVFFGLAFELSQVLALALPLVVYLLIGLWHAPAGIRLEATRRLSAERVQLDEPVTVTLEVRNQGAGLEEVLLQDVVPPDLEVIEGSNWRIVSLPPGETTTWSYTLRGKRGYYILHEVRATASETLGLATRTEVLPTDGQLFILPPVLRLRRVSIRPRRTRVYSGTIPARQGGPGVEFYDVRDYQVGDSPRSINWRVTARHPQGLYSNQYEQERVVDVGIILDGRRRTNEFGPRSIFEYSVMATAALAEAFLSTGNRVGMLFYGKQIHWTMPGYGKVQGERILHDLSKLESSSSQSFNELYIPARVFPAHSQLVLVSPLDIDDFHTLSDLRSRGYAVLVVSPNPVTFEAAGLSQTPATDLARRMTQLKRQIFLQRLRGIGVQVVDWDVALPFEQVARRELERRQPVARGVR